MRKSKTRVTSESAMRLDPLYVIFEQHLYNFPDSNTDRKTFVLEIVNEYLHYLRQRKLAVPAVLEEQIKKELENQVTEMLVKKIYGSLTLHDFQENVAEESRQGAQSRYFRLRKG